MASDRRIEKLNAVLRRRQPDLTVVMENIHDPHNVSAILRSCDATGVMEVQLLYTDEEFPDIGKKSSASAKKWVERRKFRSIAECYAKLRKEGFTIYATRLTQKSASLYDLDLTKKTALVFGNEHRGVSDDAAELADGNFQIPMQGMIHSLNVSVACAVSLFEALRQRTANGGYAKPKYSTRKLSALLKEWTLK
ncbi:MAG: RNA methyltransferase [Ignavibacteriae bacterium]|nr:RNA methyltransferase [Ignavibacteriota bacterium]